MMMLLIKDNICIYLHRMLRHHHFDLPRLDQENKITSEDLFEKTKNVRNRRV